MIALDTKVLVRYALEDDARLSPPARELIATSARHPLATFDRDFARRAARLGWKPAVESRLPSRSRSGA